MAVFYTSAGVGGNAGLKLLCLTNGLPRLVKRGAAALGEWPSTLWPLLQGGYPV
jgi:hypothetical protein